MGYWDCPACGGNFQDQPTCKRCGAAKPIPPPPPEDPLAGYHPIRNSLIAAVIFVLSWFGGTAVAFVVGVALAIWIVVEWTSFLRAVRQQAAIEDLVTNYRPCPDCAEPIRLAARVCRYCGWREDSDRTASG